MNAFRSKPLKYPWPPLLYGLAILAALVLERIASLPVPQFQSTVAWITGASLTIAAIWLNVWAIKTLLESRAPAMRRRSARHLVTRGPFRYTRNPIYLGYTLMTASFGLLTGNPWFLVTAIIAATITTSVAIKREEIVLLSRFGCDFESYCKHTRRWI
ncbi:methyltransferase family protein [Rhizobium tubonense]|uniref:Isoprenylcysteine carboxyl methyltransferase n=1 Tax=Rhizobium tubonense TaxID=484088 RepID=A0A2W4EIB3_9HYPH|nr:isoprenylcysteine carboxylmethyltransferase family protein [Rhizobium tubonense]PZM10790.1 isoprenylcysteine carboxyl methyltransferase [Rhizobium tubonense]